MKMTEEQKIAALIKAEKCPHANLNEQGKFCGPKAARECLDCGAYENHTYTSVFDENGRYAGSKIIATNWRYPLPQDYSYSVLDAYELGDPKRISLEMQGYR